MEFGIGAACCELSFGEVRFATAESAVELVAALVFALCCVEELALAPAVGGGGGGGGGGGWSGNEGTEKLHTGLIAADASDAFDGVLVRLRTGLFFAPRLSVLEETGPKTCQSINQSA